MALWNGPTVGRGMTSADLITSALDQPMSLGATLWDQAKGGALESFGLGTAIRDLTTPDTLMVAPEGATPGQVFDRQLQRRGMDSIGRAIGQGAALLENRDVALTEEEFKASPNYRIGIPYDAGMTAERQAALAEMYDIKKAREFYASKRPIAAFIGNLAGQATDPINYIPALGPATKAAAVARFGRIGGTALVAGADAAINTAAAFGATAGVRARFGDDVSWDNAVSQIATAALIGGAFGTVAGVMGRRVDVRQDALVREAEQRLATLKRTQEGRMALNDAVQSLAIDGEVRLSPAAVDVVERTAADVQRVAAPRVEALPKPVVYHASKQEFDAFDPEAVKSPGGFWFSANEADVAAFGTARAYELDVKRPATFRDLAQARQEVAKANPDLDVTAEPARANRLVIENLKAKGFDGIHETNSKGAGGKEVWTAFDPEQIKRLTPEEVAARKEQAAQAARQATPANQGAEPVAQGMAPPDAGGQPSGAPAMRAAAVQAASDQPRPKFANEAPPGEVPPVSAITANDNAKAIAEQFGVNAETGDFVEAAELDALRNAGRLTEDEIRMLDEADQAKETGDAFAEALKAAVGCLL